jgi:hypothetical protein
MDWEVDRQSHAGGEDRDEDMVDYGHHYGNGTSQGTPGDHPPPSEYLRRVYHPLIDGEYFPLLSHVHKLIVFRPTMRQTRELLASQHPSTHPL